MSGPTTYRPGPGETVKPQSPCGCSACLAAMARGECQTDTWGHCWCGPEIVTLADQDAGQIAVHRGPGEERA